MIRKKDTYAQLALNNPLKYCRVFRKGEKHYLQLIFEGIPPQKLDKKGKLRHKVGSSLVGIDIGTQTIAISSEKQVELLELAPEIDKTNDDIRLLQRMMDRSRKTTNPGKYHPNGTINRSNKDKWIKSKHYQKSQKTLCKIQNKYQAIRKQSHNILINHIISLGTQIYVEEMSFNGLQKRAKKTTKNVQGKFNKKKRFGKSLAKKAPAMLLTMLNNKLDHLGMKLIKINTTKVKASQYNHITDNFIKKDLSERWNIINNQKIQRDLYSAFLIMNVNSNLNSINQGKCIENYSNFVKLHNIEIKRIQSSTNKRISSMGI